MQDKKRKLLLLAIIALGLISCQFGDSNTADYHLKKARSQVAEGYHGSALIELKSALKINPVYVPALLMLDEINSGPDRYKENIHYLSQARKAGVDDLSVSIKLIKNYLAANRFKSAFEECERTTPLVSTKSDQIALNVLKARSLTGIGKFTKAEALYNEMLDQPIAKRFGQIGLSQVILEKIKNQSSHHWSYINIHLPGAQHFHYKQDEFPYLEKRQRPNNQQKKKLAAASLTLKELIKDNPDDLQVISLLGEVYYYNEEQLQATKSLNRALALDVTHGDSLFVSAKINFESGYFEAAKKNLEQLLTDDKKNLEASNMLAALLIRDHDLTGAQILLEHFVRRGIKDEDLFINLGNLKLKKQNKKSLQQAISFFTQATEISPRSTYSQAMLATAQLINQNPKQALKKFKQARYLDRDNLAISAGLIESNLIIKEYLSALRISKTQVSQHPTSPVAHHLLGLSYQQLSKNKEARPAFQQALTIDPTYSPARIKLADFLKIKNKLKQASHLLLEGLKHNNKEPSLLIELAALEEKTGEYMQARDRLLTVVRNNPELIHARILLGYNYLETGHINEALAIQDKLRTSDRHSSTVMAYSAKVLEVLGNTQEAEDIFEKLVKREPGNPQYLEMLGNVHSKSGDYQSAQKTLERASSLYHDKSLSTLISLADLNIKQADLGLAKKYMTAIQKLSPNALEAETLRGDFLVVEKKVTQAIETYKQVLKTKFQANVADKISQSYLKIDAPDSAINSFEQWINKHPKDLKLSLYLIDFYQQTGDNNAAIKECERIQKFYPKNIWILHKLAELYKSINVKQAFSFAKQAYSLGADSPEIHSTYNQLASLQ